MYSHTYTYTHSLSFGYTQAGKVGDTVATRRALDKYFEDLPKDGKAPFGTGLIQ